MWQWIAAVQALPLAAVLLWAAWVKLFTVRGKVAAADTALKRLVGEKRAAASYRVLGGCEAALGIWLLVPTASVARAVAAGALTLGFGGYLVYSRLAAPDASCGCLSSRGAPVSWRSFARTGMMLAAAAALLWAPNGWLAAFASRPLAAAAVVLVEAAALVAISPEFDRGWLIPLRRLRIALSKPLDGADGGTPLEASVNRLQFDDVYRHVAGLLRTDVRETWDSDGWRFICYGASVHDRVATAVFAVSLGHKPAVKVAFVDDKTGETLLRLDKAPRETERPEWALPRQREAVAG